MNELSMALEKSAFSREAVEALSKARGEPDWLRRWRLEAWEAFERLPMPGSRYTQIRGLDLEEINLLFDEPELSTVPEELWTLSQRGEAAGLYVLLDGRAVQSQLSEELKKKGVLLLDMTEAVSEQPELIKRHLEWLKPPADRMTALQRALFRGGLFLYVPKGVQIESPLKASYLFTRAGVGLFTQSFVIAEPESAVTLIEELDSPRAAFETSALQGNSTLVHVGRGARVNFAGVENWNDQVFSFIRRRGVVEQDGKLTWTLGWLGGRLVMSHVETVLDGPGAEVEDIQVFFTSGRQHFDLTSNLIHVKPHTKGEVNVKGILKERSQAVFWGLIRIEPGAQHANAFQSERSLILEGGPRSNAIPSLEIEANDVRCTHAASASQIDEEQIFYVRSRGLSEEGAKKMIVDGFFEPIIAKIPLPLVQEKLRGLIDRKWQGRL